MATAIATERLLTAEEYGRLPRSGKPTELVRGRIIERNIPFSRHAQICGNVARFLILYLDRHDIGHILTNDAAVRTERGPDTVRGADVAYLSYDRRPKGPLQPNCYIDEVPELVFEVRSPSDRWPPLMAKVAEYLEAGVKCVCALDEPTRSARVCTADDPNRTLDANAELTFPDILPGFAVRVGQFFE
jgi:Uma2 family endonuclease